MSSALVDISYALRNGIYTVLNNSVIYSTVTYPVYKSVPKDPASTYVLISDVVQTEDGTKDDFIYYGTVAIHVVDSALERPDRKRAEGILGVVRGLLKPSKASTFTVTGRTLVVFKHESMTPLINQGGNNLSEVRLVDLYSFVID
jgi:hypothetical protein